MRPIRRFITQLRTTALGPLTVVRSRDLPSTPDDSEPIVNAFNQLEQHVDGLRDAGPPDTAVPSIPGEERRAHLRLLKTVA